MTEDHTAMRTNINEAATSIDAATVRLQGLCQNEKSGGMFPKITLLPGSLHLEWRRCGKVSCHCARGQPHGPYWVRRWWQNGKQRKVYVPRNRVAEVAAGIAAWRCLHPPAWTMRQVLADLHRLEEEVLG